MAAGAIEAGARAQVGAKGPTSSKNTQITINWAKKRSMPLNDHTHSSSSSSKGGLAWHSHVRACVYLSPGGEGAALLLPSPRPGNPQGFITRQADAGRGATPARSARVSPRLSTQTGFVATVRLRRCRRCCSPLLRYLPRLGRSSIGRVGTG